MVLGLVIKVGVLGTLIGKRRLGGGARVEKEPGCLRRTYSRLIAVIQRTMDTSNN